MMGPLRDGGTKRTAGSDFKLICATPAVKLTGDPLKIWRTALTKRSVCYASSNDFGNN